MDVMAELRRSCPWDAEQTHRSLVPYLIEEIGEVVDAIEAGDSADMQEELGDLLLQVYFHAEIANETGQFDIDQVAEGICDKLIRRHPHVFTDAGLPEDLHATWEAQKRAEKGRTSALDGIATSMDPLSRGAKVISRARRHGVLPSMPTVPITQAELGTELLALLMRADESGIDAGQATRDAVRELERQVGAIEASRREG